MSLRQYHEVEVVDPDYPCERCEERPATLQRLEYPETRVDPAEWSYVCDECGGKK